VKVSRGTTLAALVLVAVAAPVTAFALADDSNDATRGAPHSAKADKDSKANKGDKPDKADKSEGKARGHEKAAPGRAHAEEMKEWARCVAEAASGPKTGEHTGPPKEACGEKPVGPGRAKHGR
jgi:hypothetical protein